MQLPLRVFPEEKELNVSIHVLGAGGIGVVLGLSLVRAGWNVTMVDAKAAKVAAGRAQGITVVGHGTEYPSFVAFDEWEPPGDGMVLLCTKTYDNPSVLKRLASVQRLIPVQNGFDPDLDRLEHPGEGIASFVSECLRDRPVTRITRPGSLHLGPRREVTDSERSVLVSLAAAVGKSGLIPVERVEDIRPYKASKLMYNAAISPLATAAGVDNGELLTNRLAKRLFFGLLRENYLILRQARVKLARIGPFHPDVVFRILQTPWLPSLMGVFFRSSLRGTYCSMAPDIGSGRTEIDAYNGHLVRLSAGMPCPMNRAVLMLMERIVDEGSAPGREHLQWLADAVAGDVQA